MLLVLLPLVQVLLLPLLCLLHPLWDFAPACNHRGPHHRRRHCLLHAPLLLPARQLWGRCGRHQQAVAQAVRAAAGWGARERRQAAQLARQAVVARLAQPWLHRLLLQPWRR